MISWFLVGALVLIAFVFVKFKEVRHKSGVIALLFIAIFFIATIGHVYSKNNLNLTTFDGVVAASKIYFSWLGNALHNLVKIGGYAIKQDWGVNITNMSR